MSSQTATIVDRGFDGEACEIVPRRNTPNRTSKENCRNEGYGRESQTTSSRSSGFPAV